jgi:hypothetical protein
MIHKNRGNRRLVAETKAERKADIVKNIYGEKIHGSIHRFSKNKIHCSCPSCSAKTNGAINKSRGAVSEHSSHYSRLSVTNNRYGRKNYKPSDRRKVDDMIYQETMFSFA